jgi:hypothetical protein
MPGGASESGAGCAVFCLTCGRKPLRKPAGGRRLLVDTKPVPARAEARGIAKALRLAAFRIVEVRQFARGPRIPPARRALRYAAKRDVFHIFKGWPESCSRPRRGLRQRMRRRERSNGRADAGRRNNT